MSKGDVQCINDDIIEKLSLRNRYEFLNNNLVSILKPKHFNFMKEAQKFFLSMEKKHNITHNEDFFKWIPEIGKAGLITRMHDFKELDLNFEPHGMTTEFMRILSSDFFDTQMTMSIGATVLAVNPLLHHNEGVDVRLRALRELVMGQKIGCMCITEPERGSDAVHMLTTCDATIYLNHEIIKN